MSPLLTEAVDEFFVARMPKKHSAHTLDAYRRDIRTIGSALGEVLGLEPDDLRVDHLEAKNLRYAFAKISNQSAATIGRTWSTWNQLFTFMVAEQMTPGNPMAAIERPRIAKSRPKAITGDDSVQRLLAAASKGRTNARNPWPERDFAVVVTLLTCGLRLSELLDLTLSSIDGPVGDRVVGVRGKGNKERTVPLEPEVETILAAYVESRQKRFHKSVRPEDPLFVDTSGEALRRGGLQYLIDGLYKEAGIRTRVPAGALVHALRHTFATSLARNGATGTELQKLLGHESLATTQRYVDASAREVRAAARSNDAYNALDAVTSNKVDDAGRPT